MFAEGHATQVEVAGIVASSQSRISARDFLAFLLTDEAQALLPETNWMYPAGRRRAAFRRASHHRRARQGADVRSGRHRQGAARLDRRMAGGDGAMRRWRGRRDDARAGDDPR